MIDYIGKCLFIKEKGKRVLVIGDLHLGYEESMNRKGVMIARGMFNEMISEMNKIFEKIGKVDLVVLLGDVKHDFSTILKQESNDFMKLFDYLQEKCKEVVIVKGNHDSILEPIARRNGIVLKNHFVFEDVCFLHGDKDYEEIYDKKIRYWIVGHAHPAIKLSDGNKVEKYKCFLVGQYKKKEIIIVPSFFGLIEGSDPRENNLGLAWNFALNKFNVKIVSDNLKVLDFGKLKKLNY